MKKKKNRKKKRLRSVIFKDLTRRNIFYPGRDEHFAFNLRIPVCRCIYKQEKEKDSVDNVIVLIVLCIFRLFDISILNRRKIFEWLETEWYWFQSLLCIQSYTCSFSTLKQSIRRYAKVERSHFGCVSCTVISFTYEFYK